jgi:hypothetical protein
MKMYFSNNTKKEEAVTALFLFLLSSEILELSGIRHQSHDASVLDRNGDSALVSCAVAGDAAREDLTALGYVAAQTVDIFVVDNFHFVYAELADFATLAAALFAKAARTGFALFTRLVFTLFAHG